jgi:hypothetical protein
MAPQFDHDRQRSDEGECDEADDQGRLPTERLDKGNRSDIGLRRPPGQMLGAERRTGDEGRERHQHARIAAADRIERTGCAAAADLHADAKQEGADQDGYAYRAVFAVHRPSEQRTVREGGKKQHGGDRKHRHLRAKAGAASVGDKHPPR